MADTHPDDWVSPPAANADDWVTPPKPSTVAGQFLHGEADPLVGAAQVMTNFPPMPKGGDWLSQNVNKFAQTRAAQYDAARKAAGDTGIDWPRIAGNILNPATIAGMAAGGAPGAVMTGARAATPLLERAGLWAARNIGVPATTGAASATLQPVEKGDFGRKKLEQAATGAVAGGVGGPIVGGLAKGTQKALQWVKEHVAPDFVEKHVNDLIVTRMAADAKAGAGPDAATALKTAATARAAGIPKLLADEMGPTGKGLAGHVARRPGLPQAIARGATEQRDKAAGARLNLVLDKYLKQGPSAYDAIEALKTERQIAARPWYAEAEQVEGLWSPRLQQMMNHPRWQRALALGYEIQSIEDLGGRTPYQPEGRIHFGINQETGEAEAYIQATPNLRTLDLAKRGMDRMIRQVRRTGDNTLTAALVQARREFVNEVDNLVEIETGRHVYKLAREAWSSPSAMMDAVQWGQDVYKRSKEQNAAEFADFAGIDKEFVRLGAADTIRRRIGETAFNANEARAVAKSDYMFQQLQPLFDSRADYDKFVDGVMAEHQMMNTYNKIFAGSPTAERMAEDMFLGQKLANMAAAVAHGAHGSLFWAAMNAMRAVSDQLNRFGRRDEVYEALAKKMFGPPPTTLGPLPVRPVIANVAPNLGAPFGALAGETGRGP